MIGNMRIPPWGFLESRMWISPRGGVSHFQALPVPAAVAALLPGGFVHPFGHRLPARCCQRARSLVLFVATVRRQRLWRAVDAGTVAKTAERGTAERKRSRGS